jgi:phospholipase/carboxylesterase
MRILESGVPLNQARLVAIMLHGRGGSADDMVGLGAAFDLPDMRFICPEARGNSWYPFRFIEPIAKNQPQLDQALATVAAQIEKLKQQGIRENQIVLCGFSQGACLTAEFLIRNPAPYAAVLIFTGGLIGPPGTKWAPPRPLNNLPVLLSGSDIDEWIPVTRSYETADVFKANGADLELIIYQNRPHTISSDELARAQKLLKRV